MSPELLTALLGLLVLLCLVLALGWWASARRAGVASRARNAVAQGGEAEAEALLEAHGFEVLDRQQRRRGTVLVAGEPVDFEVRVDLLLTRQGERFVAEIKTGEVAPDPGHPPTRRQLREYAALFPDHRVILVDVARGRIVEVGFPEG